MGKRTEGRSFTPAASSAKKMNWMGGARNRLKYQGERRIQQEFFEKRKLAAAQSFSGKTSSKKRKGLSQDLVALHTVSRVHSGNPDIAKKRWPIQKLDFEKFRSCTRQIDEVDLGPCSPSETPSKLILSDGKFDKDSSSVKLTGRDARHSRELFPKPPHFQRCYSNEITRTGQEEQQSLMKSTPMFCVESRKRPDEDINKLPITFAKNKPSDEFLFSKPKQDSFSISRTKKGMLDPYVSEDFQVTPLVKYAKKRSTINTLFDNSKKKKCFEGQIAKDDRLLDELEDYRSSSLKRPYFSSTPNTCVNPSERDKNNRTEQFGGLSPIDSGADTSKDVDSNFIFKPRPMYLTPVKKTVGNLGVSQDENVKGPSLDTSFSSTQQITESERSDILYSHSSSHCGRYKSKFGEVCQHDKDLKTSTVQCKDNFAVTECTPFRSEFLSTDHLQGTQKVSGSLGKYRNIFRHKNEQESPLLFKKTVSRQEKDQIKDAIENRNKYETVITKPKFTDIDDEFHYKPMKTVKNCSVKIAPNVIDMYKKLGDDSGQEDHENIQTDWCKGTKTNVSKDLACSSIENIKSPLPGDEFPKHLLSPSKQIQDEIDRQLLRIAAAENKEILNQESSQNTGLGEYKPLKTEMDDVLCEMKQLEEQNTITPEAVPDKEKLSNSDENIDVCTESLEADAFLESEGILLESITEHNQEILQQQESPCKETADFNKTDSRMIQNELAESLGISLDKDIHTNMQSADTNIVSVDTERNSESSEIMLNSLKKGKDSEGENESGSQIDEQCQFQECATKEFKEIGTEDMRDDGENVGSKSEHNPCLNKSEKKNNYRGNIMESSEIKSVECSKIQEFKNSADNVKDFNASDKAETKLIVLSQLQVQEIFSGKNQSTQTPMELETFKAVSEIGVQCDLPMFPSLSNLAGKCFKVKPFKRSDSCILTEKSASTKLNDNQEKDQKKNQL